MSYDRFEARVRALQRQGHREPDARRIARDEVERDNPGRYCDLHGRTFPALGIEDLTTYHRDAQGRPEVCVKVYGGLEDLTREEWDEMRAELGLVGRLAPAEPGGKPLPFGPEWCEAVGACDLAYELASELAYEDASAAARDLYGPGARAFSAGRSGGWLYVTSGPTVQELREAEEALEELRLARVAVEPDALVEALEDALPMSKDEFRDALRTWSDFADRARAGVADFPRLVAWHYGANVYGPAADAHEAALQTAREDAERRRFADYGRAVYRQVTGAGSSSDVKRAFAALQEHEGVCEDCHYEEGEGLLRACERERKRGGGRMR